LEKERTDDVVGCANDTLGFPVLWRGVWTRHAKGGTKGGEKKFCCGIIEFSSIVALDSLDGCVILGGNKAKKCLMAGKASDFKRRGNVQRK
jgi:hypothetical protein